MLGAPSRGRGNAGQCGVDSETVRPMTASEDICRASHGRFPGAISAGINRLRHRATPELGIPAVFPVFLLVFWRANSVGLGGVHDVVGGFHVAVNVLHVVEVVEQVHEVHQLLDVAHLGHFDGGRRQHHQIG